MIKDITEVLCKLTSG